MIVRVARQAATKRGHEIEARLLPQLARLLPVAIPAPRRRISVSAAFPFGGIAYTKLSGVTPAPGRPDTRGRERLAGDLGHLLARLHAIPLVRLEAIRLPRWDTTAAGLIELRDASRPHLARALTSDELRRLDSWWEDALRDASLRDHERVLRHGDPWYGNLLVDEAGRLTAVLDWEAVGIGDPADDFAAQLYLGADFLEAVLVAYQAAGGKVDDALRRRARRRWEGREIGGIPAALATGDDNELWEAIEKVRCALLVVTSPETTWWGAGARPSDISPR